MNPFQDFVDVQLLDYPVEDRGFLRKCFYHPVIEESSKDDGISFFARNNYDRLKEMFHEDCRYRLLGRSIAQARTKEKLTYLAERERESAY